MDKKSFIKNSITRSACFFAFAVFAYLLSAGAFASDTETTRSGFLSLITGKMALLLAFSAVFGFSYVVFEAKNLSSAARRTLHVLIMTVAWVPTFLLLGFSDNSGRQLVLGIIIACAIMLAAYPLGMLVRFTAKRISTKK